MKQIISQISFNVHQKKIINPDTHIISTISGGQDSIFLLFILVHLQKILNLNINIIYCNHMWQQNNFHYFFQILKICYLINLPITTIVAEQTINSEKKSHNWRKKSFFRISHFYNTNCIFTGHTASDQIETAIWHLLRGTSPTGIISLKEKNIFLPLLLKFENNIFPIKSDVYRNYTKDLRRNCNKKFYKKKIWNRSLCHVSFSGKLKSKNCYRDLKKNNIKKLHNFNYCFSVNKQKFDTFEINRPLITIHRQDIYKLSQENNLPLVIDNTNQSLKLYRNKIRLILIPLLRYFFTKKIDLQLKKYLNITKKEQNFLNEITFSILESYCTKPEYIQSFFTLPINLQQKSLQYLLEIYTGKQIQFSQIFQIFNNE